MKSIRRKIRDLLCWFKKPLIKNKNFTLLSNGCVAGLIYHDYHIQFQSPTINMLFFLDTEYITFVENFNDYILNGELLEAKTTKDPRTVRFSWSEYKDRYPIMILKCNNLPDLYIHFVHDSDANKVKANWERRCKRINFDNIIVHISLNVYDGCEDYDDIMRRFNLLPYKKICFTRFTHKKYKNAVDVGDPFALSTRGFKLNRDKFNWIKFINSKNV